ncbi:MAG: Ni/Fe hydrogenase subunit alpha [Ignisphaera sp.]
MLIEIKPVTRIEGHLHAYIEIGRDDVRVQLRAGGFRGFERILIGRPIEEAPHIAPRICGVCPVAHHLASAKAVDALLGVDIPRAARIVREIMGLGGVAQSHLLHLGFLIYPDIEYGRGSDAYSALLFKKLVTLRRRAVRIVDVSGGRHVHPFNAVPGGVLKLFSREDIEVLKTEVEYGLKLLGEVYGDIVERVEKFIEDNADAMPCRGVPMAALAGNGKGIEMYDGVVKVVMDNTNLLFRPNEYMKYVVEESIDYSYSKRVYIDVDGVRKIFRVGPLPRLLTSQEMPYDASRKFYRDFELLNSRWPLHPLVYNLARIVEIAYCFERIAELLNELQNVQALPRTKVELKEGEGIGIVEAPRGLLIHHYKCNGNGVITYANIITPTTVNIPVMEYDIREMVKLLIDRHVDDAENIKRRILYLVRSYDPCVSCATHTIHIAKR